MWRANKAKQVGFKTALEELLNTDAYAILLVNGEAILTDEFKKFAGKFLRKRKVFAVADETSLLIKSPSAKRTKVMNGIKKLTEYRLILDGTPAGESPLDLYSQIGWLDEKYLGHASYFSFKNHYGVWEKGFDPRTRREFPKLTGFKNLPELQQRLAACSMQARRKDYFDMPDKIYQPYRYPLSPTQRRVYDEIEEDSEATLIDNSKVGVRHLLTRYLRFQQILGNVWPSDKEAVLCPACDGEGDGCERCQGEGVLRSMSAPRIIDPKHHPRLDALIDCLQVNPDPVIVWARFDHDIEQILSTAKAVGRTPVRYDGKCSPDEKEQNKRLFQSGRANLIAAKQASAQRGLDLSAAGWHLYYSNTFSGLQRQQTEDRTEVPGRPKGTGIIDLIAEDTIDDTIASALLSKKSVAEFVMQRVAA